MAHAQKAIILLSRGGYSQAPQRQLNNLVTAVQAAASPDTVVMGAVADKGSPSLPDVLQQCADTGARQITVQPVFLPGDDNLQRWLAKVMARWYSRWTGEPLELCLADSLGDYPGLRTALVEAAQTVRPYLRNVPETPPTGWEADPAGWSNIPDHTHHVFLCQGPRCTGLGTSDLANRLRERLRENKLTGNDRVLVAQTGCLYPCNLGPVMVVYPEGVWYGRLTPEAIDRIVDEHFIRGKPLEKHVFYPAGPKT